MKLSRRNRSSNEIIFKDRGFQKMKEPSSTNLKTVNLNNKQCLFDFISDKNKIRFNSCFDKKGAKKFLSDKNKAMKKITLFDEILDGNDKEKKNNKDKDKKRKKKPRRSISDNLAHLRIKNHDKKSGGASKNLKNSQMVIKINYVDDDGKNKNDKTNMYNSKKKLSTLNSIHSINSISSGNFSSIKSNSPMNLAINKNDSFIFSIVSEMSKNVL